MTTPKLAHSNIPATVQPGDFFCVQLEAGPGRWIAAGEIVSGANPEAAEYQHAGIVTSVHIPATPTSRFGDPFPPKVMIIEAERGGARETEYHYNDKHILWSTDILTPVSRPPIVAAAEAMRGAGYSYLDYLSLTLHHWHLNLPGLRAYIDSTKHVICSQLIDKAWDLGNSHLFVDPPRWSGDVQPADLAQLLLDKGAVPLGPLHDVW